MLRTTPRVDLRSGKAALVIRNTELRLMLTSYSQSLSVMDSQEFLLPDHALLTRISIAGKCSWTWEKNFVAESFSRGSSCRGTAWIAAPYNWTISWHFFTHFAWSRLAMTRLAPSSASVSLMAVPR